MKAKFFFLGLCALALAACSIDEVSQVNDTNAVTFKVTASTRAEATTTNNLQEFTVWAWNDSNLFMDAVTAEKSGTSTTFTTSPLYFWPTGSVNFYALTEVGEHGVIDSKEYALLGGQISEGDDTDPTWTYEGAVGYAVVEDGSITIDACIPSKPEEQIDICYAVALGKSSGSVPTNFRHALSQVAFKAKSVNSAFEVKIADVSVCSVYKEGTYVVGKTDTATHLDAGTSTDPASSSQGVWTLTTTDADSGLEIKGRYLVNMESNIVDLPSDGTTVELADPNGTLMLLPQQVDAWDPVLDYNDATLGSYLRILCHVEEAGAQLWPTTSEEDTAGETGSSFKTLSDGLEYAEIAIPVDADWEQGYRYTYTLIFGEGLGYYPPDDPNVDLEGTPVLRIINFDVTVDEFQDAENTDGKYDVSTDVDLSYIEVKSADELVGAARMGYEVIDVTDDITLENVYVEFTQDCTLNLAEGVTITATNSTGTDYPSINGYNGYTAAICVTSGTLTINGEGSVVTTGGSEAKGTEGIWVNGGEVIINGGTYKGGSWNTTDEGSESAVFVEYGAAYIYGGTFYSGKWKESGDLYYVLNCMDTPRKNGQAWIYVYGGTYYLFDPSNCNSEGAGTNFVVDGYSAVADGDYYNVIKTTVTTAADLKAAIAAGASEVTIADDITINDEYLTITSDCTVVLDEGATLYSSADWAGYTMPAFYVTSGTLTIEGEGTVAFDPTVDPEYAPNGVNSGYYGVWVAGGTAVINGGNFISADHAVYCQTGYAYIYGGNFSCTQPASNGEYMVLNCRDANYPNSANIYVYGGSYGNSFDPSNNLSEGEGTNFVVSGYVSTKSSDVDADGFYWYTVTAE